MPAFDEVQFPTSISKGSSGGPERRTDIVELRSGFEERNTIWADSRRKYDAGLGLRNLDDLSEVLDFFEARMGQLYGFRWKDWADYKSCRPSKQPATDDQLLGAGDGTTTEFQLVKVYSSGLRSYVRTINKPVAGTVVVEVDGTPQTEGVDFTVDTVAGTINLVVPPPIGDEVKAGFEFDVPVRFDVDMIEINHEAFQAGAIPNVEVIEVRV